jgi:dTDP-4-dehydrorhamnose reductase
MKIILFGSNGMLGSYLRSYLSPKYDLLALTRSEIDLSMIDEAKLFKFLNDNVNKDDVIINAGGVIPQRGESNIKDTVMVNSIFPHILAKFKQEVGCHVVHITTDCVFSGKKGGYVEEDPHDCIDVYGKSKSLGENINICNIRTSIIGEEKRNKKSLVEWVLSNKGKTIDGYENHLWNGVTCLELAKLIDKIIEYNLYWEGVRHVFSPEIISKYELISMINEIYGLGITINKKTTDTNCHRNLSTSFEVMIQNKLKDQILELKEFKLA